MMSSAAVAAKAPLASEPVLDVLRRISLRATSDQGDRTAAEPVSATNVARETTDADIRTNDDRTVTWVGPKDNLWLVAMKNYGLTLATFGVYYFWGRAEMTRQTVNAIHIDGKPLDYTGTGKEAFISFTLGAAIAIAIVSAFFYILLQSAGGIQGSPTLEGIRSFRWQRLAISLPLLFLLGSITYRKRHHILRRTWINGERFGLTGHAWSYASRHFGSALLVPLTFGWAAPWRSSMLEARKISEMQHGTRRFVAKPELRGLYRAFALVWFGGGTLYVVTLVALSLVIGPQLLAAINGLTIEPLKSWHVARSAAFILGFALLPMLTVIFLYQKAWLEHQVSTIGFDGGRFRLKLPTARYLALSFSGLALSVLSLGCFKPVSNARYLQFVVEHVRVEGSLKLAST
jgi:uncharacterized membrane protein YjgN (DUF898 family)